MPKRVVLQKPNSMPEGVEVIEQTDEILELINHAAHRLCKVNVKAQSEPSSNSEPFESRLLDVQPAKSGIQVQVNPSSPHLIPMLKDQEYLLLIFVGRYLLGVPTQFENDETSALRFKIPKKLFKIQRRKSVRYVIPGGYDISVEVDSVEKENLRARKKLLDISEGGLAFLVLSAREASLYRQGGILKNVRFKLRNQEITVDAKVANQIRLEQTKDGGGVKIGVEFHRISAADRNFLASFVYSQLGQLLKNV